MAFRALVTRSFEVGGRGTSIAVEILDGMVRPGDQVIVPLTDGQTRVVSVRGVEIIDCDIGTPTFRSEVALLVRDVLPTEVLVGKEIASTSPHR